MSLFGGFGTTANNTGNTTGGNLFGATNTTTTQPSLFGNTNNNTTNPTTNTTGSGLFGSTANTANTTGGGLFGNTANTTSNTTSNTGGLFGNTNNTNNTTGGGLFGNSATNTTGGGLFGNTNNATNTTGGGLFGSTNTNANATAAPANTGSNIFGGFGATNTNNNANTAATGGGLFGGQTAPATGAPLFSTNTNTGTSTGGGLFGNTNTTTGGNLFGNTQNNANTNTTSGGGLFGGGATNTTGGLFGSSNNANTGGGLFGGATTNNNVNPGQQAGSTGGLFGNTQNNTQAGTNLFGAKPATGGFGSSTTNTTNTNPLFGGSLFGQQQPQQQQSSLFGSTSAPSQANPGLTTSALGPSNLLSSRSTANIQQQNSTDPNVQFARTAASIEAIYNAWNPASKDCRFQTFFYNIVDPNQVHMYGRPANATNDSLWEKAVRENPDPSCYVPVVAIGFDDIRERIDAQTAQSTAQIQKLADLQARLTALRTQHSVTNTSRLLRAAAVQTQLAQRVMRFVQHLHLLIPAVRSSALRPEEEKLRRMLEELEEEMRRGRVKSRLNELWARIGAVNASAERANSAGSGSNAGGLGEWAVVDEEGLTQIAQILKEQQAGLQYLTKIVQKDQKDLEIILGTRNAGKDTGEETFEIPAVNSDWGSSSTLRASALR